MSETLSSDAVHETEAPHAGAGSYTTRIAVAAVLPTAIAFNYDTPPGNRPATYANTVFLWQTSSDSIPGTRPLASVRISSNQPAGSGVVAAQVTMQPYLLGYATGPGVQNVCATVFIPATGDPRMQAPSLVIAGTGPSWIAYGYDLPAGTQPSAQGHWVGVWRGTGDLLYSVPPLAFAAVPQNASSGNGVLQDLSVLRGVQYTLGYFAGGYAASGPTQTTLACSTSFMI